MRPNPALLPSVRFLVIAGLAGPLTGAIDASAAQLDLPVWTPGSGVKAPCYRGDVLEVQLTSVAARLVLPRGAGRTRAISRPRLGVPALDAVAAAVGGVGFEPEFRGETAPEPGAGPDLTAFELLHLAPGSDLATALDRLRALPEVASADPIALMPVSALPNDSLAFASYWLENVRHPRADIHAPEAWQVTTGDTSIVVGIIDTGVIPFHPDLGGRAGERGQMWINWAEKGGLPGVDDDGNGFVDDVSGWDFVQASTNPAPGEDGRDEDNDPDDWGGHGTAVAGIVGAISGNGIGLSGVVPQVRLMPLRIGWLESGSFPPAGTVDMSYAAAAIRYATRMGCAVVNCSWQSLNLNGLGAAVTAATQAGVVVVNASGNFGTGNTYLGQRDDVIAVSGTDTTDVVWPNAVVGPWVDLSAASIVLSSTMFERLAATDSIVGRTPAYRGFMNGTSFAAPQVAGAVALLQAQRKARGEHPLTPAGALLRVRETTDDISALQTEFFTGYGTGRLNVYRALTDPTRSLAVRARARTVGPAVVLRYNTGRSLVVYAMTDRSLLAFDGASGDTAWVRTLPSQPVGDMAAVDRPLPFGPVIAVATTAGTVFLIRDDGTLVAGWPVTAQVGLRLAIGTAIADVDGDGEPDIVSGGSTLSSGRVWAWHLNGAPLAGFPFDAGVPGVTPVALADLDGVPGAEIVYADDAGSLHEVGKNGQLGGFPTAPIGSPTAPVIARSGNVGAFPSILLASGSQLTAYEPDGSTRWTAPLAGTVAQDPVLADLDGDGADEIVLALAPPNSIAVLDSSGAPFSARPGWPRSTFAGAQGPLVVGPLEPGHATCVMYSTGAGLMAFDELADSVRAFPNVGSAGLMPSLADLDGDGATEVAAGASPADSNIYTYDAGPGTWSNAAPPSWPTPRGDMARTASHIHGTPPPFVIDRIRPAPVTDLEAHALTDSTARVSFRVTGDDSLTGQAAVLQFKRAPFPLDGSNFLLGTSVPPPPLGPPGSQAVVDVQLLPKGSTWWFAVRVGDAAGNLSAVSNSDSASLPSLVPSTITDLRALAATETTVVLGWSATGDDGLVGRPVGNKIYGSTAPLDSANLALAPLQTFRPATQDPGAPETTLVVSLTPGRRWRFAVRGVDHVGNEGAISNVVEVVTPVGGALTGHLGMAMAARPQPAATSVTVDWQGDPSGTLPQVLVVYDINGRVRRRIPVGTEPGGSYNWDGRDGESRLLPAGLYFVRLVSGARHAQSRVVFVR